MAKPMDLELKKAFADLQKKMIETSKKIKVIDAQIEKLVQSWQYIIVSRREFDALPPGTKTYQPISRMFLLAEVNEVLNIFYQREGKISNRVEELQNNKQYLEKNLKESSDNIREMVQQRKEQKDS